MTPGAFTFLACLALLARPALAQVPIPSVVAPAPAAPSAAAKPVILPSHIEDGSAEVPAMPVPGAVQELIATLACHPPLPVTGEGAYALDTLRMPPNLETRRPLLTEAIALMQQKLASAPHDAQVHEVLAAAHFDLGEFERAAEHFRRAVELQPHQAQHHNDLGVVYLRQGRIEDARRELTRAFKMARRRFAHLDPVRSGPLYAAPPSPAPPRPR